MGDLIGRQLCPAFADLEDPIKIVAEVVFFCGSSFGSGLVFVVGVKALVIEDGAKYCFQAPTLRAAKLSCILQQDELAFAAGAVFHSIVGCGDRLGV